MDKNKTKFKVGDVVKCIDDEISFNRLKKNHYYIVKNYNSTIYFDDIELELIDVFGSWYEHRFELAKGIKAKTIKLLYG